MPKVNIKTPDRLRRMESIPEELNEGVFETLSGVFGLTKGLTPRVLELWSEPLK
jgi:hypothetical protein